jgi:crotonobetainyl-CoA:carnitine CoA-transferase CaiB-like acyl-CoA transferase
MTGPLAGLRVFDLTRILAGPTCTQLLGDLGAEVIKIERPGEGDDTRKWGPPYLKDAAGRDSAESAYYLSSNRNKRSLTLDIAKPEGQALARRLIGRCDFLVENFKAGGLAKYGLAYDDLRNDFPGLIYCSITGFGQSDPVKVGVGISDVMCGMYAVSAILAALHHRTKTGKGQYIDLALLDTQVAWLINEGLNYLTSGEVPLRRGGEHANIVPYNVLPAADGHVILAVGNNAQFRRFCAFAGAPELADDPRFRTNTDRVNNREALYRILPGLTRRKIQAEWVDGLAELGVPSGPVNTLDQVFADPQVRHRGMKLTMDYDGARDGTVDLIANPIRFSGTQIDYRYPPPKLGEHTDALLQELLDLSPEEIAKLRDDGAI